jgi:hypothetical protein
MCQKPIRSWEKFFERAINIAMAEPSNPNDEEATAFVAWSKPLNYSPPPRERTSEQGQQAAERGVADFDCIIHGRNKTHDTKGCFQLKRLINKHNAKRTNSGSSTKAVNGSESKDTSKATPKRDEQRKPNRKFNRNGHRRYNKDHALVGLESSNDTADQFEEED